MSRERDSAIVYELVTSKYKIAQRNRLAKLRFLNEMKSDGSIKRRDSEPSMTAGEQKVSGKKFDLSVPGTPVSSRYIKTLRMTNRTNNFESDSETEAEDNDKCSVDGPLRYQKELEDGLKQFTADMEKLQGKASHDPLKQYFEDSDKKKTYRRDFSEVVAEFPAKKTEPQTVAKVERYFQESHRRNSFKRDFGEVVQSFDPRNPSGREQFTDLKRVGTPISSRLVAVEKLSSEISNQSGQVLLTSTQAVVVGRDDVDATESLANESENALKIIEDIDEVDESKAEQALLTVENVEALKPKLKRSDSTSSNISNVSVPGTPVSSRDLLDSGAETDDNATANEITALAQQFVHEIECLVQKSFDDDDKQEIVTEELKRTTMENGKAPEASKGEAKLIIHEKQDEANPGGSGSRVEDYFEMSAREKTFARTFSEVESFNKPTKDVQAKVESYFRSSDEKKSLTRPFSQAVNYVQPRIDIERLMKPGTPISSKDIMCLKRMSGGVMDDEDGNDPETLKGREAFKKAQEALKISEKERVDFVVDNYFKQSEDRSTYRRDFSEVMGELNKTPTNTNPNIERYFEQSEEKNSFQRPFSEVFQSVPPRIEDILKIEEKQPLHHQRSSRASSISSNCSDMSESGLTRKSKKHGKKYGIDKYFATSLYRTAYHRSNSRRTSRDGELDAANDLKIVEDEFVFGETDMLRQQEFQHDDETKVTAHSNETNENQTVHFWRDFLKPYNLDLQTDIKLTKDDLLNDRTLE